MLGLNQFSDLTDEEFVARHSGGPLWLLVGLDISIEILNEKEYLQKISRWNVPNTLKLKEATRAATRINMSAYSLVEILSDSKKWSTLFFGFVLKAKTAEIHSRGRNYNGALQVILIKCHLPSPTV